MGRRSSPEIAKLLTFLVSLHMPSKKSAANRKTSAKAASRKEDARRTTPKPKVAKKRERRKEDRPDEILAAALSVFETHGFAAAKISDIAKQAGVAKGTVYLYFETKDQLFEALVRERIKPTFLNLTSMLDQFEGSATELLRGVIRHFYGNMVASDEKRAIMKILISEGSRFPNLVRFYHREVLAGAEKFMGEIVRRGIASGEFREAFAKSDPRVIMAPALMAAVHHMAFEAVAPLDRERFVAAHIDLVLNGLKTRP